MKSVLDFFIIPFILSFIGVLVFDFIRFIIGNVIKNVTSITKFIKIEQKILSPYIYPCFTILIAIILGLLNPFFEGFWLSLFCYLGFVFLNYRFTYKLVISKIIDKIKGLL